jgi:hypothetical protein
MVLILTLTAATGDAVNVCDPVIGCGDVPRFE